MIGNALIAIHGADNIPDRKSYGGYIGIDPGKTGAISSGVTFADGSFLWDARPLGAKVDVWPDILREEFESNHIKALLVEMPHMSMGKASFNAGIIYGMSVYAARPHNADVMLMHPNAIVSAVGTMTQNLLDAGVNIAGDDLSPSDYGNKLARIRLALTIGGDSSLFRKSTGKINDNITDAFCHMMVCMYVMETQ